MQRGRKEKQEIGKVCTLDTTKSFCPRCRNHSTFKLERKMPTQRFHSRGSVQTVVTRGVPDEGDWDPEKGQDWSVCPGRCDRDPDTLFIPLTHGHPAVSLSPGPPSTNPAALLSSHTLHASQAR